MRQKVSDHILIFNNSDGEWLAEIISGSKRVVRLRCLNKIRPSLAPPDVWLFFSPIKKSRTDFIVEKATELGVSRITPIISERTEVKELNYERAQKIVIEATEQSNQFNPPELSKVIKLKDFLEKLDSEAKFLFADVNSQNNLQKKDVEGDTLKTILIGPEGDFSPSERESILAKANTTSFSISKNILRSDTAVISAISLVNFINNFH